MTYIGATVDRSGGEREGGSDGDGFGVGDRECWVGCIKSPAVRKKVGSLRS